MWLTCRGHSSLPEKKEENYHLPRLIILSWGHHILTLILLKRGHPYLRNHNVHKLQTLNIFIDIFFHCNRCCTTTSESHKDQVSSVFEGHLINRKQTKSPNEKKIYRIVCNILAFGWKKIVCLVPCVLAEHQKKKIGWMTSHFPEIGISQVRVFFENWWLKKITKLCSQILNTSDVGKTLLF